MATKIEFKQQCPSCEAQVPIKDRKLIGRKIDCPKCKYRFVVEDPEAVEEETPTKKGKGTNGVTAKKPVGKGKPGKGRPEDEDGKPKKKKEDGDKTRLYVGLGLGLVALILLGIVGWILFGPDDSLPKNVKTPPTKPGDEKPTGDKPKHEVAVEIANPTNLLPNDTQTVISVNVERALGSQLSQVFFGTPGSFNREAFNNKFGFAVDNVKRAVLASNLDEDWSFNVLSTVKPIDLDDLKKRLMLKPGAKSPIQGLDYFVIDGELDSLSKVLLGGTTKPLAMHQVDTNTLVVAHMAPMEKFLEAKGKPKLLTQAQGAPPEGEKKPGEGEKPPDKPAPQPGLELQPDKPQDANPKGDEKPKPAGGSNSYLTVNPILKGILDRLEEGAEPVIISRADLITRKAVTSTNVLGDSLPQAMQQHLLKDVHAVGQSIEAIKAGKLSFAQLLEYKTEEASKGGEKYARTTGAPASAKAIQLALGLNVVVLDEQGNVPPPPEGMEPPPEGAELSKIAIIQKERSLSIRWDLLPTQEMLEQKLAPPYQGAILKAKGKADMTPSRSRVHELAAAVSAYTKKHGQFPRGTLERTAPPERAGLSWNPDQRLSWMFELLPHLGANEFVVLYDTIKREFSWRDPENLLAASTLVPHFLSPNSQESQWWVKYPGLGDNQFAATHFVGIAGVGPDSASPDFPMLDPNWQKKIGVFGYERVTKLEDIKDDIPGSPSCTIVVIQVPPHYKTPWLAGGGSTIRGVAESDSVRPFVCVQHNGKQGTFAIMADGAVRFICPEDITEEQFKALCTINGGEKIDNLDEIAPLVPGTKTELKPMVPPDKVKPPDEKPKPPDKPEPPKDGGAAAKADLKKLHGKWKAIRGEEDGTPLPDEIMKTTILIVYPPAFEDQLDPLLLHIGFGTGADKIDNGFIKVDATKSPRQFDFFADPDPKKGKAVRLGIYEFEGDRLKLCIGPPGAAYRPTEFSSKTGKGTQLFVFKRD